MCIHTFNEQPLRPGPAESRTSGFTAVCVMLSLWHPVSHDTQGRRGLWEGRSSLWGLSLFPEEEGGSLWEREHAAHLRGLLSQEEPRETWLHHGETGPPGAKDSIAIGTVPICPVKKA